MTFSFSTQTASPRPGHQGDFFGAQRLTDLVIRNLAAGLTAPETLRRVVRALLKHQAGGLTDDATLLLVEWQGFEKPTIRMAEPE